MRTKAAPGKGFEPNLVAQQLLTLDHAGGTMCRQRIRCFMKRSRRLHSTPSILPVLLHQRLNTYALAAGAAGVSLLALSQPSDAEVVYTPADQVIGRQGSYKLDLNHDGIIDYIIAEHAGPDGSFGTNQQLSVKPARSNHVLCSTNYCISTFIYAAALGEGFQIGPNEPRNGWLAHSGPMAFEDFFLKTGGVYYAWAWVNVNDRYLGLRFEINGETHYGWARLSVRFHGGLPKNRTWEARLTGYAYETIAGKAIIAGKTSGNASEEEDQASASRTIPPEALQFAALGKLALGANGFELWRRDRVEAR
jgi:hypothetical protein